MSMLCLDLATLILGVVIGTAYCTLWGVGYCGWWQG